MSADVEVYDPQRTSVAHWAREAADAHKLAQALVKTSFAPKPYRDKPDEAAAAILKGAEIGLTPIAALSAINVIAGTPALSALALRALVQSQGHTVWIEKSSDREAVARGRRRGETEEHVSKWTISRANALGAPAKNPNWKTQPESMLIARATSEVCRMIAADALLGVAYSVEELADDGSVEQAAPAVATRARRARPPQAALPAATSQPEPAAEPAVDEPPLDDDEGTEEAVPSPATAAQVKKIHATFGDVGWSDREDKLRACSIVCGRPITSSKDLSKDEAMRLIDLLDQVAAADDPPTALTELLEQAAGDTEVVEEPS